MDFKMSKFPIIILACFMIKSSLANEHKKELKDVICAPYKYGPVVFVPHPYDCSQFFMCSNSEAVEFMCPNGLLFDTDLNVCNYPNQVTCVNSTTTLTTTTLPTSSTTISLPTSSTTLPTSPTTTTLPTSSTTTTLGRPVIRRDSNLADNVLKVFEFYQENHRALVDPLHSCLFISSI